MTWLLERGTDLLLCEIRRTDTYLREQSQLRALGWRPRTADVDVIR